MSLPRDPCSMFQFLGLDQIAIDSPQKLAWQEKIHPKDDRETCVNRNFELDYCFTSSTMDLRTY